MADLLMIGLGVDTRRLRDGERALGSLQQAGNRTESALGRMAATLASAFAVDKIANYADEYISLSNKIKLVTNSAEELAQGIDNIHKISQNSLQGLSATGDVYFKISQNADKLGLSVTDVSRITETFTKTLAISGASTQGAEAAILQFGQALASGVIRGDEFNSVAENAPAAMDAFARALDVSKGELRKLAAEGKLTSEILIQALKEQSQAVDELFGKTETTMAQGFQQIKNSAILLTGKINEATGASKNIVSALTSFANLMDGLNVSDNAEKIGQAFDYAFKAAQIFVGLKVTGFVSNMALSAKATVANMIAQQSLKNETIALSTANVSATGIAARRAEAEAALTMQELAKARAISATTLATYNALVADAERARLDAVLAAGTAHATAAELQRTVALDRVALAQEQVTITANAEAAAVARATAAASANTAATVAQTEAQLALEAATRRTTGVLAGLGGPLNAVITLLGMAATAWFVFGDNGEKAADKTKQAIDKIKNNLNITDDEAKALDDALKEVEQSIKSTIDSVRAASLSSDDKLYNALNKQLQELYNKKKEIEDTISRFVFNRTLDDVMNNLAQQGVAAQMLKDKEKQIEAEKEAKKAKEEEARAAEQLKNRYNDLILSQKERIELWGNESELAKINFDLQNTELSKLEPKLQKILRLQAEKIDALKAEEEARNQQKQTDDFMAQQAQELDALRQSYATKNEIVNQAYLQREAIIQRGIARGAILENEAAILRKQNEQQYADERVAIAKEEEDRKRQIELERLQNMSQLFGNLATLMQTENRKLFEIGKAAAIAQAIVNTATAITNALAVPPFPLGFALAATAGVAGAVQIATIQNQQMKGARAMGGDVQAGNSYLVGERGAEIITMGGNGHVTPNHKLGGDTKVTIVNQTTGKIDKVEERRMPDGELILTVIEAVAAQTLDPNSKISRNQAAAFGLQRRR